MVLKVESYTFDTHSLELSLFSHTRLWKSRYALSTVYNALIKSKKHPEITTRYRRIRARRGHKKAIIAICRMLLTAIWHILTDLKPYTPEGFLEQRAVKEEKILTTSQALNLLKQRGYIIKDEAVSAT